MVKRGHWEETLPWKGGAPITDRLVSSVTALESVCTGQVYVPTLVLVVKSHSAGLMAGRTAVASGMSYLLIYNLMFIVPLVSAFLVTYQGLKTERLLAWSRRNVVPSKILLGLLFAVLAVLMWVT